MNSGTTMVKSVCWPQATVFHTICQPPHYRIWGPNAKEGGWSYCNWRRLWDPFLTIGQSTLSADNILSVVCSASAATTSSQADKCFIICPDIIGKGIGFIISWVLKEFVSVVKPLSSNLSLRLLMGVLCCSKVGAYPCCYKIVKRCFLVLGTLETYRFSQRNLSCCEFFDLEKAKWLSEFTCTGTKYCRQTFLRRFEASTHLDMFQRRNALKLLSTEDILGYFNLLFRRDLRKYWRLTRR